MKTLKTMPRDLLGWAAMLLAVAALGLLALPGFFSLTLKLATAAVGVGVGILWLIYPKGKSS
jgi:hypothetical protein